MYCDGGDCKTVDVTAVILRESQLNARQRWRLFEVPCPSSNRYVYRCQVYQFLSLVFLHHLKRNSVTLHGTATSACNWFTLRAFVNCHRIDRLCRDNTVKCVLILSATDTRRAVSLICYTLAVTFSGQKDAKIAFDD